MQVRTHVEYEASVLVAFYGRYVAAMENFRAATDPKVREYHWGEVLREHRGLVERAPSMPDDDNPQLLHIWLPARGRQGATWHLPRYQIRSKDHKTVIWIFDEGEFKEIPDFDEELIQHTIHLSPDGKGAALLYGEPVIQY